MKYIKIKTVFIIFTLLACTNVFSQDYSLGGSIVYNFKTNGLGLDLRAEFPIERIELLEGVCIVPQFSFFPSFNKVTDFHIGSSVHLAVYKYRKWIFYTLINASFRAWKIQNDTENGTKYSNVAIEGGIGITRHTCLRPFLEFRINAVGVEPNIRFGFLYTFNCNIRGAVPCPKIPAQPDFN